MIRIATLFILSLFAAAAVAHAHRRPDYWRERLKK